MQFIPNSPIPPSGMISRTLLTVCCYSTLRGTLWICYFRAKKYNTQARSNWRDGFAALWEPDEFVNPTDGRDSVKTRITVRFLFLLFRVISWIACYAPRKAIPEIT